MLDITFRGIEVSDDVIGYVRRSVRRLAGGVPCWDGPVCVRLERREPAGVARVTVIAGRGTSRGEDLDELLAVSNAFALLRERLADGRAASRPGLASVRPPADVVAVASAG